VSPSRWCHRGGPLPILLTPLNPVSHYLETVEQSNRNSEKNEYVLFEQVRIASGPALARRVEGIIHWHSDTSSLSSSTWSCLDDVLTICTADWRPVLS